MRPAVSEATAVHIFGTPLVEPLNHRTGLKDV